MLEQCAAHRYFADVVNRTRKFQAGRRNNESRVWIDCYPPWRSPVLGRNLEAKMVFFSLACQRFDVLPTNPTDFYNFHFENYEKAHSLPDCSEPTNERGLRDHFVVRHLCLSYVSLWIFLTILFLLMQLDNSTLGQPVCLHSIQFVSTILFVMFHRWNIILRVSYLPFAFMNLSWQ